MDWKAFLKPSWLQLITATLVLYFAFAFNLPFAGFMTCGIGPQPICEKLLLPAFQYDSGCGCPTYGIILLSYAPFYVAITIAIAYYLLYAFIRYKKNKI